MPASRSAPALPPPSRALVLRIATAVPLLAALGAAASGMITIAFSPLLIGELQQLPRQELPAVCIQGGIAGYSGVSLVFATPPSVNTACLRHLGAAAGQAVMGPQPLLIAAALLVVGALAALVWRPPAWRRVAALAPLLALLLMLAEWALFAGAFESRFGVRADAVAAQPSTGLWVVGALLLLACLAGPAAAALAWARQALEPLDETGPGRQRAEAARLRDSGRSRRR